MPVNPNEAPAGFIAVETRSGCEGCAFTYLSVECLRGECASWAREDFCNVIFAPITDKPATANFPHDDMGTPV